MCVREREREREVQWREDSDMNLGGERGILIMENNYVEGKGEVMHNFSSNM